MTVRRKCPFCDAPEATSAFPYKTLFNEEVFRYWECAACRTVFVDPIPSDETFALMYAKADYHDRHYEDQDASAYKESARLLRGVLPAGASVLDYGCGTGGFLMALRAEELMPVGVEFDEAAARAAGRNANCETLSVEEFRSLRGVRQFDALHLGDVLEHLPDPKDTLQSLLPSLRPGGLLFVEGPLEINPSPVYWAIKAFGEMKRLVRPRHVWRGKPTHLIRTGATQQHAFFGHVDPELVLQHWSIYETGWPYRNGRGVKQAIAGLAIRVGGIRVGRLTLGNRFRAILKRPDRHPHDGALT
jgi:2-polyprenyl-3-methyl-5-hydroxy-6-metoxy-1,4-benzoquinol methylase